MPRVIQSAIQTSEEVSKAVADYCPLMGTYDVNPTTLLVDPQVYRLTKNSSIPIEARILLKVWDSEENSYCIVNVKQVERPDFPRFKLLSLEIVEYPFELVNNKIFCEDGQACYEQPYAFLRPATTTYPESVMVMNLNRTYMYLDMEDGTKMYEYMIPHPCLFLGKIFHDIRNGKDKNNRYHFVAGKDRVCFRRPTPPKPVRPASKNTIPLHIFRVFVDQVIEKKEDCPITMEPLTLEDVASPPCGHLFHYDAIVRALKDSGKCPTCRCVAKVEEIQHLN